MTAGETGVATSPASRVEPETVVDAARLVKTGQVFDLDTGRFPGMPESAVHVPFTVTPYRTPRGLANQGDQHWLDPNVNTAGWGFVSELVITSMHTGTHIDALCHVQRGWGDDATWFGGRKAAESIGDFGPLADDAAAIPPLFLPGVLLDAPLAVARDPLPAEYGITPDELTKAAESVAGGVPQGGVILVRTGYHKHWPDTARMAESAGAGITLEAAQWLVEEFAPVAIGADTPSLEQEPSAVPGNPAPAHQFLIRDSGIHIIENLALEQLAAARVNPFLFVCLPLAIHGATASIVRPIAVC
ncbi:MAG: cyclase family protein [Gaiellaceae bacterium]